MSDIDHAAQAQRFAGVVAAANGDHLNTAQTCVADGLAGLIHAMLAIHDDMTQILGELRIANYDRTNG